MLQGLIRLCYRKLIDASSQTAWERYVFDDTYLEFYMQAQFFNQEAKYTTFQELIDNVPNAARLHHLTSAAALSYIRQLDGRIPDITTRLGKHWLPFTQFKFEIIQSHVQHRDMHKIAILFYSEPLTWIATVHDQLLVAGGDQREALQLGKEIDTELIALQPYLSISSFQPGTLPA